MSLIQYIYHSDGYPIADEPPTPIAINPRYVKTAVPSGDCCYVRFEGDKQGVLLCCSYERFLKDVAAHSGV